MAINVLTDELGTLALRSLSIDDVEAAFTRRTHTKHSPGPSGVTSSPDTSESDAGRRTR